MFNIIDLNSARQANINNIINVEDEKRSMNRAMMRQQAIQRSMLPNYSENFSLQDYDTSKNDLIGVIYPDCTTGYYNCHCNVDDPSITKECPRKFVKIYRGPPYVSQFDNHTRARSQN